MVAAVLTATTMLSMLGIAALPLANAQSTSDLQAQIAALLAQIQQLQGQLNGGSSSSGSTMYNFTRDLTVGSSGADVTSLQQLLITKGYLKVSAPTGYFGALTQKALAAWQAANGISPAAGYFGPKTRAFVNSMSSGSTGGSTGGNTGGNTGGGTQAPATGVSVSLASNNPGAGSLITTAVGQTGSGAARVPVLSVNLTAGNSGSVTVSEIKFHKTGVLADNSIAGAYIIQNGQVLAQYNSINQGVIDFSGLNLSIGAGQTQEVTLAIDVAGQLAAGNTTGFSLNSASDVTAWTGSNTAVTPSGMFPLNGNTFTVTSVSNPSLASLTVNSSSIGQSVTAGTQNNLVGGWQFNVGNSPVWLQGLNFHVIGSANVANIQNVKLMVNGTQAGATLSSVSSNGTAYFNLSSTPVKLNTGNNNVQVFADVMGSPSYTFQFEILNGYDVLAVDSQYNVPVSVNNPGGADLGEQITIQNGQITVTQDTTTPTGSIAKGTSQVTLAKYDIYAAGEPVRVRFLGFSIDLTSIVTSTNYNSIGTFLKNISLVDDAGGQIGSTINTPPSNNSCDAGTNNPTPTGFATNTAGSNSTFAANVSSAHYVDCFGTNASPINYQVPANTTRVLSLKADVQSLPAGTQFGTVTANLTGNASNLQGVISSKTVSSGPASGSSLSLANSSLTVSQNNALGNQSISAGVTNQRIGSYTFQAASAEGVNVNNVQITVSSTYFANLHLMVNGAQFGTTQGQVNATTYTFSGSPFNVPAGGSVNVDVYADTLSSGSGTVSPATILAGCSASGQISFSSISCTAKSGQNITFGAAPQITVSADSTEPPAGQIVMGSTGNTLGVYRFTETSNIENVKVTDLQVVDAITSPATTTSNKAAFSNLQMWNGSTLLGTAGAPTSDASGTAWLYAFHFSQPIIIPQANSVSVTLKGDAATYASQGATDNSAHQFEVATTTDTTNSTSSQTVIALGATSNKATAVTLSSANGNTETVLRTVLGVTTAPLGGSNHSKSNPDQIGTITFTANSAGPAALNNVTTTFTGSAATSSLYNATSNIMLIDQNGNNAVTSDGAVETTSTATGGFTAAWTFGAGSSGFQISAGSSYTFTVRLNTSAVGAIPNVSESLSANIQGANDVHYTDGLDSNATSSLGLPTSVVPLTINSVTYPVGQ